MLTSDNQRTGSAWWLLVLFGSWVAAVACSLLLSGSGFLHPESYSFLPHYLSGRPFWELIYDNQVTDWGNYQARELAFVIDWCDAQFIAWSVKCGHPHFFSASHYLLLLIGGLALWQITTRHLGLSQLSGWLIVLLLWTAPTAMLYTSFYRSAKVGLLCATLVSILAWLRAAPASSPWGRASMSRLACFAVAAALLPMFDKQGLLFLLGWMAFLLRNYFITRGAGESRICVAGAGALVFAWAYQRFIGPSITAHLLGYEVVRGYATIPFKALATQPAFLLKVCGGAAAFTLDSFRIPLGNLPAGVALAAAAWIGCHFAVATPPSRPRWLTAHAAWAGLALLAYGVFAAMLMLFPQMLSNEHRRFFYPFPFAAPWLVAASAAMAACATQRPGFSRWIPAVLGLLVLSNLFALQEHRFFLRNGKYRPFVENAASLRDALQPVNLAKSRESPTLAGKSYLAAPYFRDAVPPSLKEDRIFLLFLSRSRDYAL